MVVRVRPPLPREIENGEFISTVNIKSFSILHIKIVYLFQVQVSSDKKKINIYEYYNIDLVEPQDLPEYMENQNNYTMHQFSFDYVYDQESSQEEVYETTAKPAVMNTLEGFNATIMAYGQTGTQWKVSNTITMTRSGVLSLDALRRSLNTFKTAVIPRRLSWFVPPTFRSTMNTSVIC